MDGTIEIKTILDCNEDNLNNDNERCTFDFCDINFNDDGF